MVVDFALHNAYRNSIHLDERPPGWDENTASFDWGAGRVRLPGGYTYRPLNGIDTFIGEFTSAGGELTIRHDIGELAYEHGSLGPVSETLNAGARVQQTRQWVAAESGSNKTFAAVAFPDSGCAIFYASSSNGDAAEAIGFLTRSFQPRGRLPGWTLPLLPEVLRTGCRIRCLRSETRRFRGHVGQSKVAKYSPGVPWKEAGRSRLSPRPLIYACAGGHATSTRREESDSSGDPFLSREC